MSSWLNTYKFVQSANVSSAKAAAAAAPPRSSGFEYRPASNYLLGGGTLSPSPYAANQQDVKVPAGLPKYQPGYWSDFLQKLIPSGDAAGVATDGLASSAAAPGGSVGFDDIGNGAALSYLNADLAKAYGMDASTAYQEALANTSYQRGVKDMQAAGLNPAVLFGAGRGSAASSSVYNPTLASDGSSVGGSSGASSAKRSYFWQNALSAVGGLIGVYTKNPSLSYVGRSIGNVLDSFGL